MRNNRNSIVENVILFLVAIGVFAIIGGLGLGMLSTAVPIIIV